ncbi:hypothetical protein AC249_AIPGENE17300 [Exaiptasia diaphana]|nr:hypothetical protein AC249_AIPGENE17300 [Exaiptasia diaphana]
MTSIKRPQTSDPSTPHRSHQMKVKDSRGTPANTCNDSESHEEFQANLFVEKIWPLPESKLDSWVNHSLQAKIESITIKYASSREFQEKITPGIKNEVLKVLQYQTDNIREDIKKGDDNKDDLEQYTRRNSIQINGVEQSVPNSVPNTNMAEAGHSRNATRGAKKSLAVVAQEHIVDCTILKPKLQMYENGTYKGGHCKTQKENETTTFQRQRDRATQFAKELEAGCINPTSYSTATFTDPF